MEMEPTVRHNSLWRLKGSGNNNDCICDSFGLCLESGELRTYSLCLIIYGTTDTLNNEYRRIFELQSS